MASLLERIEQLGAGGAQPQQRGIEEILRAGRGKAGPARGPAASALGEEAAITAGREALREQTFAERLGGVQARGREEALAEEQALRESQLRRQEQQQREQLAAQATAARQDIEAGAEEARLRREAREATTTRTLNARAEQQLRDLTSQRNITTDDLFAEYRFDLAELRDRQDASQLEQRAFLLAMQDRAYLEELDRVGKEQQLTDDLQFEKEMNRLVFGNNMDAMLDSIDFNKRSDQTDRERRDQLAKIDINTAIDLAQSAIKDNQVRNQWQAASTIAGTVAPALLSEEGDE